MSSTANSSYARLRATPLRFKGDAGPVIHDKIKEKKRKKKEKKREKKERKKAKRKLKQAQQSDANDVPFVPVQKLGKGRIITSGLFVD